MSVVIAAYNASRYLPTTLESVLSQTYPAIEIIVVDDGSTDDTRGVLGKYEGRIRVFSQANAGQAAARNLAINNARGTLICPFDADDLMHRDKVSTLVKCLQMHPECAAVYSDYVNFTDDVDAPLSHFRTCSLLDALFARSSVDCMMIEPEQARHILIRENFTIAGSALLRLDAVRRGGGYPEKLCGVEDFALHYRICHTSPIAVVNRVLFRRRLHGGNVTNQREFMVRQKIQSRLSILASETVPSLRAACRASMARCYEDLAWHCSTSGVAATVRAASRAALSRRRVALYDLRVVGRAVWLAVYGLAARRPRRAAGTAGK